MPSRILLILSVVEGRAVDVQPSGLRRLIRPYQPAIAAAMFL